MLNAPSVLLQDSNQTIVRGLSLNIPKYSGVPARSGSMLLIGEHLLISTLGIDEKTIVSQVKDVYFHLFISLFY
jgi:hypothetical protein